MPTASHHSALSEALAEACPPTPHPTALQAIKDPQALHAAIHGMAARCAAVLAGKQSVAGAARDLLRRRDDQYVRALRAHGEETDGLIAALRAAQQRCRAGQEAELEAAEAVYLQVAGLQGWRVERWAAGWSAGERAAVATPITRPVAAPHATWSVQKAAPRHCDQPTHRSVRS